MQLGRFGVISPNAFGTMSTTLAEGRIFENQVFWEGGLDYGDKTTS
jgi:hypothetical protein